VSRSSDEMLNRPPNATRLCGDSASPQGGITPSAILKNSAPTSMLRRSDRQSAQAHESPTGGNPRAGRVERIRIAVDKNDSRIALLHESRNASAGLCLRGRGRSFELLARRVSARCRTISTWSS